MQKHPTLRRRVLFHCRTISALYAAPMGRQHPHQSEKVLYGTFSDSFSLEGEAFGENSYLLRQNEQRWMKDKASPLGEKLSSPGSSEPGDD